jgi:hypothetical protein
MQIKNSNNSSTNPEKRIQTVERNIKLLFTDQYDTAFAQIRIKNYGDTVIILLNHFHKWDQADMNLLFK